MKISLVVPFLNEEDGILDVLDGVEAQTVRPDEIVLVDAGSTDTTVAIIQRWATQRPNMRITVLSKPGALPGAGRNHGVRHTQHEWVAFLDAGIRPSPQWLEKLIDEVKRGRPGAWGTCRCVAHGTSGTLTVAYSLGQGSLAHYVLPASLFHKKVFQRIGFFREDLRAGEDTLWRNAYFKTYGQPSCVIDAEVSYTRFPPSIRSAYWKWALYARHMNLAGVGQRQAIAYLGYFTMLLVGLLVCPLVSGVLLIVYVLLRGVWDPQRRSAQKPWWGRDRRLFFLGPIFVFGLDAAKAIGFLQGFFPFRKTADIIPHL